MEFCAIFDPPEEIIFLRRGKIFNSGSIYNYQVNVLIDHRIMECFFNLQICLDAKTAYIHDCRRPDNSQSFFAAHSNGGSKKCLRNGKAAFIQPTHSSSLGQFTLSVQSIQSQRIQFIKTGSGEMSCFLESERNGSKMQLSKEVWESTQEKALLPPDNRALRAKNF